MTNLYHNFFSRISNPKILQCMYCGIVVDYDHREESYNSGCKNDSPIESVKDAVRYPSEFDFFKKEE